MSERPGAYLALTGLSQLWPEDGSLVLLGPWCLTGPFACVPKRPYEIVPCPWPAPDAFVEAARVCEDRYFATVDRIGEAVAELRNAPYDAREWHVLSRHWLNHVINMAFERFTRVRHAADLYPDLHTTSLEPDNYWVMRLATDLADLRLCHTDAFNLQLIGLTAEQAGLPARRVPQSALPGQPRPVTTHRPPGTRLARLRPSHARQLPGRLRQLLAERRAGQRLEAADGLIVGLNARWWEQEDLCRGTTWTHLAAPPRFAIEDLQPDLGSRSKLAALPAKDAFEALLFRAVVHLLPVSLFEGHDRTRAAALRLFGGQPRHVVAQCGYSNDLTSHYLAHCAGSGRRIFDVQHGICYGQVAFHALETVEVKESDGFLSWGWRDADAPEKTIPAPSPSLSHMAGSHGRASGEIVYVATGKTRYSPRLGMTLPEDVAPYVEALVHFEDHLPPHLRHKLVYRLFPLDTEVPTREPLLAHHPKARLLEGNPAAFHHRLRHCRLAIIDHLGEPLIEALAMNTPTVLFWDPATWPLRAAAEPYFDALREAKVLHDSGREAAAHLAAVYDHLPEWWDAESVQRARNAFLREFGLTSDNWVRDWRRVLSSLPIPPPASGA